MTDESHRFRGIPIVQGGAVRSGQKYATDNGFTAIKDGLKRRPVIEADAVDTDKPLAKPAWLRARVPGGGKYGAVKETVRDHRLATVCEESKCPNIGECWSAGTATLMVMGAVCTRACRFCSACVKAIKALCPETAVEALTPDFDGRAELIELVVDSGLEVFAQNVETVERLTHPVRDPRAGYAQTLGVLEHAKTYRPDVLTKTSLMLGLGETTDEVLATMDDLRARQVDVLTLGQYLRPTANHLPVERYVHPDEFAALRDAGLERGFREVVAGPLVRSSYRAERVLDGNNVGLQ